MLKGVFYFLKGYVIIKIEGKFPERFLNVASKRQLLLWDVQAKIEGITAKARARDFSLLQQAAEGAGCTIKVLGKIGLPYTYKRHKSRKALLYGIILFLGVVFGLLSLLWDIQITGLERIDEKQIRALLKQNGIYPYCFVYGIDTQTAKQNISAVNPDIAWIGIEIKGSCAFVDIVETVPKPEIEDTSVPCNLVSDKDGLVVGLEIKRGTTMVKIGDTVTSGQLLASGVLDSPAEGVRLLHAAGDVYVKTWHQKQVQVPLQQTEYTPTNQTQTKYSLQLFGWKLPLYFKKQPEFEMYDTKTEGKILQKHTFTGLKATAKTITEQQAVAQETENYKAELSALGNVENISHTVTEKNGILYIGLTAEVIEKTGVKTPIERDIHGENFTNQ